MARSLRPLDVYPITVRTLDVLRVADVTPGMRRVTLGGAELAAHTAANGYPVAAFRSDGFDDEGKLILQHPDAEVPVAPTQADGVLNWPRDNPHLLFRTYTIRRWDPAAGEVDLDFVKHGVGPATSWAYSVQPGERVTWAGPKSSAPHPVGADWTLVAGDETALPAIGRWLEEWPEGARGQVFIEVAEASHRQLDLPVPDGVEITWLTRDGAEPGTTTLLFDAIRAAHWWEGTVFAWVAGETLTLTPIRRWLRNEKGLPKEQVEVTGYWRRQEVVVDESGALDLDATEDDGEAFHELSEIAPGFVLRVAATIGLAGALGDQARTVVEVAEATDTAPAGVEKLLRYLTAIRITEQTDGGYRLTSLGRSLENDYVSEALSLTGLYAQRELGGLLSLLAAVRTGRGDHDRWFGAEWADRTVSDATLLTARVEEEAGIAEYEAGAVAAAPVFDGLSTVVVVGRAPGAFAEALVTAREDVQALVVAAPSELDALRALHGEHARVSHTPGTLLSRLPEPVDAVLLVGALSSLPDADAAHALREAAASVQPGGRVLVFGEVLDPVLADEHEYEDDLIEFALTGGGARTHDEHLALFAAAGLGEPARSTIGWGNTLYAATAIG
ncbi:siderophore-interacting protein [Microbacterium gubbeenense]|uniref:siderophore-interacting protein n=1 Tax=Microbacterium gubbeenense TaxID=159896 RepID=UPI0003F65FA2|nr:siderophore-interacting protein [Microbacterium gubbeenense]